MGPRMVAASPCGMAASLAARCVQTGAAPGFSAWGLLSRTPHLVSSCSRWRARASSGSTGGATAIPLDDPARELLYHFPAPFLSPCSWVPHAFDSPVLSDSFSFTRAVWFEPRSRASKDNCAHLIWNKETRAGAVVDPSEAAPVVSAVKMLGRS